MADVEDRLSLIEEKLDIALSILMATSKADQMGRIAKARKKLGSLALNPVLASIRKANDAEPEADPYEATDDSA